jgi:hypothetical protein
MTATVCIAAYLRPSLAERRGIEFVLGVRRRGPLCSVCGGAGRIDETDVEDIFFMLELGNSNANEDRSLIRHSPRQLC